MATVLSAWVYMAGAQLCFWLPLNRRPDFVRRAALCFAADFALAVFVIAQVNRCGLSIPGFVAASAGFMVWSAVATRLCTPLNTPGSVYCAVWVLLVAETAHELWLMLVWTAEQRLHWTFVPAMQPVTLVLYYLLLRYTAARTMPQAGSYRIGPRQLVSGLLLSAIFVVQSVVLLFQRGEDVNSALVVSAVLTQLYCLTLLYLQTELFKKSAMKKEMDMSSYDEILLGFPIWWYVAPTIVNTFLEAYDFSGKKIVLFATSGGSGFGNTVKELQPSAPDAVITEGSLLNRGTKQEISEWVKSL